MLNRNGIVFNAKKFVFTLMTCLLMLILGTQILFHTSVQAGSRPESPTNLVVAALSSTQIQLGWLDNSTSELGFVIYRSKEKDKYIEVTRTKANVTTCIDSGLIPGITYHYRVRSFNSLGLSDFFTEGSAIAGDDSLSGEFTMKLQSAQQKRQQVFQTLSNILRKANDTTEEIIQNLK